MFSQRDKALADAMLTPKEPFTTPAYQAAVGNAAPRAHDWTESVLGIRLAHFMQHWLPHVQQYDRGITWVLTQFPEEDTSAGKRVLQDVILPVLPSGLPGYLWKNDFGDSITFRFNEAGNFIEVTFHENNASRLRPLTQLFQEAFPDNPDIFYHDDVEGDDQAHIYLS